ncbi:MAG: hypothetical protein H0U95_13190 [Bacteroidetes bacterium]|nr:hypothetical protein [Bacteroidota bacterium]
MKLKSISALLISAGLSCIYSFILNVYFHQESAAWWQSMLFFAILFIIFTLLYFIRTDAKTYTGILLSSGVVKFLLSSILLLVYSFTLKGGFLSFSLHFIGHYVLFTVFEIRYLLQLIKTKKNEN